MQFDLISIDAPYGGDMPDIARIDVRKLLPQCLKKQFIILLDDDNRSGEKAVAKEMTALLQAAGIPCKDGAYHGEKSTFLLCDEADAFFTSL